MGRLEDKVALVTGASSGIGEAIAQMLANEGASLALVARDASALNSVADDIRRHGGKAEVIAADITDDKQIHAAVDEASRNLGPLDILVNSAGVMLLGPIINGNTKEWRRMMDVNTLGLMYAVHAVLPWMIEQGGGHVVNISSVAGRVVWSAGAGGYMASKFAVNAFSESLRPEDIAAAVVYAVTQSPNVNVNESLVRPTAQIQ